MLTKVFIFDILIALILLLIFRKQKLDKIMQRIYTLCYQWDEQNHLDICYMRESSAFSWCYRHLEEDYLKILLTKSVDFNKIIKPYKKLIE